jgi:hypothetical protein
VGLYSLCLRLSDFIRRGPVALNASWRALVGLSCASLITSVLPACPNQTGSGKTNGWYLALRNPVLGNMTFYLSKDGGKLVSGLISLVVRTPSGKIYAYNPDTKLYTEYRNTGQLQSRILQSGLAAKENTHKFTAWSKRGSKDIDGLPVAIFTRSMLDPPCDSRHKFRSTYEEIVWIANIGESKTLNTCFRPIQALAVNEKSPVPGIILRRATVWNKYVAGKMVASEPKEDLTLIACKRVAVKKNEFDIPSDYKKAKSESEILPEELSFRFK